MCDQQSLRSACAYVQSDQSLCLSLKYSMTKATDQTAFGISKLTRGLLYSCQNATLVEIACHVSYRCGNIMSDLVSNVNKVGLSIQANLDALVGWT